MSQQMAHSLWEFFPQIKSLPTGKKKRFFSTFGLSNPSAKAFFLADYIRRTQAHHIFFLGEKKAEVYEYKNLLSAFLGDEYDIFSFSIEDNEDLKKREKFILAQKVTGKKKTVFLLTREQTNALYPHPVACKKKEILIRQDDKIKFTDLIESLGNMGYISAIDEHNLTEGEFIKKGDMIKIFPLSAKGVIQIDSEFDEIQRIFPYHSPPPQPLSQKNRGAAAFPPLPLGEGRGEGELEKIKIFPVGKEECETNIAEISGEKDLLFVEEFLDLGEDFQKSLLQSDSKIVENSAFPRNEEEAYHLRYLSVLRFYSKPDFVNDIKEKVNTKWKIFILSKRNEELKELFLEHHIPFTEGKDRTAPVCIFDGKFLEFVPPSFQNTEEKILFLTDREIFHMNTAQKKSETNHDMMGFLTSLRAGDYVVHTDHGIGKFLGITEQKINDITKEYLEIEYLKNDKLFVPIEYADKVSRFITDNDSPPKLTTLGGKEWSKKQSKAKKESEKIAKELLNIYALRAKATATQCREDSEEMRKFEDEFPYIPTPGQMSAIRDIKKDLEKDKPMDRLVCGDVGFGKTEVAMRAAFKAVDNGMQVAIIAPITILVDQHYKSFVERFAGSGVKIEELSRFRTPKQQKATLERMRKGQTDIVIGTHRLLSKDIKFHNLGLLIIDEEQRFGVKQKEQLKDMRKDVHILTMTATPIPRTLNLSLHKLREISTITTPPPGRLPVITEVRKYSDKLIRDALLKELERGGQAYFLHNRVETIEGIADKLRHIVPEATFEVAHGQMNPHHLEKKIMDFKARKFDVLVSSTIIENGIDLANANTMIINNADKFGLSQLYQLRGRIGRSNRQAYAYLMYSSQKLPIDSKKRLRAIVEASELGSGFQLSMRDLEIRGAGDVLGASQHGSANAVGVNHFLKLLHKTIRQMEREKKAEISGKNSDTQSEIEIVLEDIKIDIPLNAFIPSFYVPDNKEKILMYQRFARSENLKEIQEISEELTEEYGKTPKEVRNLIRILEIKFLAKQANVTGVKFLGQSIDLDLTSKITAKEIMHLLSEQPFWKISGNTLQANPKDLGINFVLTLEKALELLRKK